MNFLWLDDFLVLAASGNFSRAAEERNVTQPAFSRRVRALESWLGVALFDRSSQPARLTEAGEWFKGVAQDPLARVARMPADARSVSDAQSATLRLAATHALSFTFLPRWLRALEAHTALGPVQLMSDVLQRCETLMEQGKVQFIICHTHPDAKGTLESLRYESTPIGSDTLLPLSAADRHGAPLHSLDARRGTVVPVLEYSSGSGMGRLTRALVGQRLARLKTRVVFTAHLASVLRTMALDGRGVAWLPRTLVEEDMAQGRLVPASQDTQWNVQAGIRLFRSSEPVGKAAEGFWAAAVKAGAD